MPEEENKTVVSGEVEDMTQDYLATIKELKEKSVDRSKYEELRAENKKLLEAVVNGSSVEAPKQEVVESIPELRKALFNEDQTLTNLEFTKKSLELRRQLIANGEPDPFLPVGNQIQPSDFDVAAANKVAEVLQECVDYAGNDNDVFTNELMRRTADVKIR